MLSRIVGIATRNSGNFNRYSIINRLTSRRSMSSSLRSMISTSHKTRSNISPSNFGNKLVTVKPNLCGNSKRLFSTASVTQNKPKLFLPVAAVIVFDYRLCHQLLLRFWR